MWNGDGNAMGGAYGSDTLYNRGTTTLVLLVVLVLIVIWPGLVPNHYFHVDPIDHYFFEPDCNSVSVVCDPDLVNVAHFPVSSPSPNEAGMAGRESPWQTWGSCWTNAGG